MQFDFIDPYSVFFLNHVYTFLFQKTSNFSLGQMELKMADG